MEIAREISADNVGKVPNREGKHAFKDYEEKFRHGVVEKGRVYKSL